MSEPSRTKRLRASAVGALRYTPTTLMRPAEGVFRLSRVRWRRTAGAWTALLRESEGWPREELEAHALRQLKDVLAHAYEYVPYYRKVFELHDAHPKDVEQLSDLALLPMLDKQALQQERDDLLATNVAARDRVYSTTAGSTGVPVGFFQDRQTAARDWAFMTDLWKRVGYREGDRLAVLRGTVLRGDELFERDPRHNALVMSSYQLTGDNLQRYVDELRRFQPRFVRAYPSSATLLARYMRETEERPIDGLRAVLCGSENLYEWQREQIAEAFGCRVFSWYGQSERVCLAGECEVDTRLHVYPQYGVTEIVGSDGRPIDGPGRPGEIVATGFLTRTMPLLRYRTGDIAVWSERTCACGRPYDLIERVEGRKQEFIVSRNGRYVSMTAINMHSPVFDNLRQFRFRQSVPGEVTLAVVPTARFDPAVDEPRIRKELAPKLGADFELTLQLVDDIPPTRGGKFRFLDQELPGPFASADD
jgi:phenylacetate-CoA ligase